jgi:uncharacterized damage-inducible protein DinB
MNSIMQEQYPMLQHYQALRNQLMEMLSDEELAFNPGGENPALGALCREIGEVEQAYIDSFKTFQQDFDYRNEEEGLEGSVERLAAWFAALDEDLRATLEGLSEEEIQNRMIDRGGGFTLLPTVQLHVYKEALLIFYGKASVYLKAMGKQQPEQWQAWIA